MVPGFESVTIALMPWPYRVGLIPLANCHQEYERIALKQRSDIVAEHRVSIIGFVWRPEEIIPSVIQMAHRTGSRAIFDFSMMGVEGLRSFLRKADPAGHVRDSRFLSLPSLIHLWGSYCRKQGSTTSG